MLGPKVLGRSKSPASCSAVSALLRFSFLFFATRLADGVCLHGRVEIEGSQDGVRVQGSGYRGLWHSGFMGVRFGVADPTRTACGMQPESQNRGLEVDLKKTAFSQHPTPLNPEPKPYTLNLDPTQLNPEPKPL